MSPRLVGVGVGPGDPELLTLKAARVLRDADAVFVPATASAEAGRAEAVVAPLVPGGRIRRLSFAMADTAAREANWDRAGAEVVEALGDDGTVAFATLGDPNLYSTFTYLAETVRALLPTVAIETVPGIMAMQDLAARAGVVVAEGTECLALLPLTAGVERLREALVSSDTVVCYKGGRQLAALLDAVRDAGRLEDAIYGARLGLPGEVIRPAAEMLDHRGPYLSTVIVPARRTKRGGKL